MCIRDRCNGGRSATDAESTSTLQLALQVLAYVFLQTAQQIKCLLQAAFRQLVYSSQETVHNAQPVSYTHLDVYKRQLLESMIAEAAARFISMDSSTRNAKNMLDSTKLQYNKLRQAKITKELIELSSSME